jgi:hypothetical protein
MRADPLPAIVYRLVADTVTIGFVTHATFPTTRTFEFETSLFFDQWFLASVSNRGYLQFHQWTLTTLDTAFQEIGRVVWRYARVMRVRFPRLQYNAPTLPHIFVQMAIADVRDVDPSENTTTMTATALSRRADPLPVYALEWTFDGLGSTFAVSGMDAFYLGDGATDELVLTVSPEANADLFRDWRDSGNTARDGSLRLLNSALQECFIMRCSGLRIRSVTPAITTHAPSPATVRLTYTDMRFGAKK